MPSINPTLSGSGKALISGGSSLTILEIAPKLIASGFFTNLFGPPTFPRVFQAGWVGVGADSGGGYDLITWGTFLELAYKDYRLGGMSVFADSYFWDLTPGCSIALELDW
jgi:hypothetical protein